MSLRCYASGKPIYPMDAQVKINEEMIYLKAEFKCKVSGATLTMKTYRVCEIDGKKECVHENHVPKVAPMADAGVDITTEHFMNSQAVASSHHTAGPGYVEGDDTKGSGYAHIPEHVTAAKE